jgi:Protein of unknown function (DUF2950)
VEDSTAAAASTVGEAFTVVAVIGKGRFHLQNAPYDMENEIMYTTNLISETSPRPRLNWMAVLAALGLLAAGCSQLSPAQGMQPQTFSSPGEATQALFEAVQNNDEEALERVLGGGKEVTSSSDEMDDKLERERFSQKYQQMHRLVQEPDGSTALYVGAENWPFPIPLLSNNGAWYFDSDAGSGEIRFRTIGENEITAIQVCHVVAKAKERSGKETTGGDPISQYARSLVSGSVANINASTPNTDKQSHSFHGYYFRPVTGDTAAGPNNRVSGSRKTDALALVAFPADYRSSGVMTFIVTKSGVVYEKDLGLKTTTVAKALERSPDSSWHTAQ